MLKRLDKSPEDLQDLVSELVEGLRKTRADEPENLLVAGNELVRTFLDEGLKKLKSKKE
jgi:hypothetical protein